MKRAHDSQVSHFSHAELTANLRKEPQDMFRDESMNIIAIISGSGPVYNGNYICALFKASPCINDSVINFYCSLSSSCDSDSSGIIDVYLVNITVRNVVVISRTVPQFLNTVD